MKFGSTGTRCEIFSERKNNIIEIVQKNKTKNNLGVSTARYHLRYFSFFPFLPLFVKNVITDVFHLFGSQMTRHDV